ncbi:MAG: sporulation protein [Deltaproteobacteria bacterium]|nr:sporulation protein [Deltaproteobacteria bacterium]
MGLLDGLFGGGTKLDLKLDAKQIPEGGLLAGQVTLSGGKKPLKLTSLKVKLVYVKVTTKPGSSLPQIDMQMLLDNSIVANVDLAPASLNKYSFSFTVPKGTDPNGSYQVVATADIPSVKDPSASCDLKVLPAQQTNFLGFAKGGAALSADEMFKRFPGLQSSVDAALCDALREVLYASYDPDDNLLAAEPLLARHMREGSNDVRAAALEAWGNILNNRARKEHIVTLTEMARDASLSKDVMRQVVVAAAKFAEEGAWDLVVELAAHKDPSVREEIAGQLYFNADKGIKGRKELILKLTSDENAGVRRAAWRGMTDFNTDKAVVEKLAAAANSDPSPDVVEACLSAITFAHHHGMRDLVFTTFLAHTKNPHTSVRRELAQCLHWLPEDPRLAQIVTALFADGNTEVRKAMAWQSCNMAEHKELRELFVKAAVDDKDEDVRGEALGGLDRLMPLADVVAFCRQRLATEHAIAIHHGVLNAMRDNAAEPSAKALIEEMTKSPHARISERAREMLA